jgi:hypothetical protein
MDALAGREYAVAVCLVLVHQFRDLENLKNQLRPEV